MANRIKIHRQMTTQVAHVILPTLVLAAIDRIADRNFKSRSEVIRSIVLKDLRETGLVAPIDADDDKVQA